MSQPRLVPVRSAFGTFIFACLFIAHLIVVLRMVEAMPLFRNDEQVYLNLGAYGLSFAISLLSGLCLVSSAYTKHYFKIGILITIPNASLFWLARGRTIETVILMIANQLMAISLMLGGLFLSLVVPFKMTKNKFDSMVPQVVVTIPSDFPGNSSKQSFSLQTSIPATPPRSFRPESSRPMTPITRPMYFAEAHSEAGSPPTYHTSY